MENKSIYDIEEKELPSFMSNLVNRAGINMINDKSLKQNSFKDAKYYNQSTAFNYISNSELSQLRKAKANKILGNQTDLK
jgi:hypothetical protein